MAKKESDKFKFRRHATIGAAAAEEDDRFLSVCFVDTVDLDTLIDCKDPRRIILGRTGTGKTALLNRLSAEANTIVINPESLSFNYLTNSTILKFFLDAGVNLDLFFKLLWRHVFTVELLKRRYNINNETAKQSFLSRLGSVFLRDKKKERAVKYLMQWGELFWEDTEYRIKEITSRIEEQLKGTIGAKLNVLELGSSAASVLSEEEKLEVVQRGQTIINEIQMKELTDILEFLNEDVFVDPQQHFYICIDKLDENWVEDRFRFLLIRSLIETIRDFLRVRNVKIVVAIRTDLIERVIRLTRDQGFQEEKYRSLYLPLRWTLAQLREISDRRINFLVKQTYTTKSVGYKDILPATMDKINTIDYMVERTLMRPRELIEFFNACIEQAEGRPSITKTMITTAEGIYSKDRLRSLQDEWVADYPTLLEFTTLLRKKPTQFKLKDFDYAAVSDFCLNYGVKHETGSSDFLWAQVKGVLDGVVGIERFLGYLMHVFYRTGIVGLKTETYEAFQWSFAGTSTIAADTIDENSSIRIHPTFYRVLGVTLSRS
jgi:hypothetical protein